MNVEAIDLLNQIESLSIVCALTDETASEKGLSWHVFNIFAEGHFKRIEEILRNDE